MAETVVKNKSEETGGHYRRLSSHDEIPDAASTFKESKTEGETGMASNENIDNHKFVEPVKKIKGPIDIARWQKSQAYKDYLGFIQLLNDSVKCKKTTEECTVSETCQKLITILEKLDKWVDEIPPIEQPQRFGNKAFRDWYKRLQENADSILADLLPENLKPAIVELKPYLVDGFGNSTRIDYGTGHEMSYAAFLCCLYKLRVLTASDHVALVHRVFVRYLELTRKLQTTYRMEPAGSQGVWGLDDFQFLPFIWGSSQLLNHPTIEPKDFLTSKIVEENHQHYMFLGCIRFINLMKTGPFAEHSNTLWGISGVPHWAKVNSGLIKMYKAEVLAKFPVIQHFPFGTLMSLDPTT